MTKKFEDVIAEQGRLVYTNVGDSMYPIIHDRDLLIIEAVRGPLRVGDVPLYKRDSGQYVLHRIVAINRGRYDMKGDNRAAVEKGVTERHIIGVLTGVVRNGRTYPVETLKEHNARIAKDLIYLVACAVNDEAPDRDRVADMDLSEVYRLSREHLLTAAAAYALERTIPLPHAFDQAKKKAIRKTMLFETERAAITLEFEKAGIWYLPLKGILLKEDYPRFAMREMLDNDILVDNTRMDDVRAIMEGLDYTCGMVDTFGHDVYTKPPTLTFEMHRALFSRDEMPLFADYYADIIHKARRDGCACKLSGEDFYLYVLCHAYKHSVHAGVGLRALLDIFVYLRAHPDLDREYLDAEFDRLGIGDFEEKMRRLSDKVFTGAALDERDQDSLDYMISSGSRGTVEIAQDHRLWRDLGHDDSNAAKRRLLLRRVFITGKDLEKSYPYVAKHKALYPLLIIYRPLRGIFTHPKGIVAEYKKIKHFKKKDET